MASESFGLNKKNVHLSLYFKNYIHIIYFNCLYMTLMPFRINVTKKIGWITCNNEAIDHSLIILVLRRYRFYIASKWP